MQAKRFLQKEPLKNSYLIARLDDYDVIVYNDKDHKVVLIESDGYISMRGDKDGLVSVLSEIDDGEYRFHAVDNEGYQAAKKIISIEDDRPTWFYKRPSRNFEGPDIDVEKLVVGDAEEINKYWGLQGSDSTDYISERISNGPAYGIRRDGELVAWTLTHYITDQVLNLGFLHVKEDWRRRGFAKAITEQMCRYAEENGQIPVVDIFKDNEASISLAESLGFEQISEHHWFSGAKE